MPPMDAERADVAIVGAGVAAAAAVIALSGSGLSIVVVGASRGAGSVRVGESLAPSAEPILRRLGAWQEFLEGDHRRVNGSFSAWGSDLLVTRSSLLHLEGAPWHVDRSRFEEDLWRTASRRTAFRRIEGLCREARFERDRWRLRTDSGLEASARFVIDASGRACAVARRLSRRERQGSLVAAYARLQPLDPDIQPTPGSLVESVANGWLYSALLPDGSMMVNAFSDADLIDRRASRSADAWAEWIANGEYTRRRIETAGFAVAEPARMADASSSCLERFAGPNWAATGDAAASFDPLSSHGLATALWSGERAAIAARDALAGNVAAIEAYQRDFCAGIARYRQELGETYGRESRFEDSEFWRRRRLGSVEVERMAAR